MSKQKDFIKRTITQFLSETRDEYKRYDCSTLQTAGRVLKNFVERTQLVLEGFSNAVGSNLLIGTEIFNPSDEDFADGEPIVAIVGYKEIDNSCHFIAFSIKRGKIGKIEWASILFKMSDAALGTDPLEAVRDKLFQAWCDEAIKEDAKRVLLVSGKRVKTVISTTMLSLIQKTQDN